MRTTLPAKIFPCRWSRKSIADQRYLLSLRDLNLSNSLADLVDAGVCSFKIEGRLKNKAYVMNVVGHYRHLLDKILNERSKHPSSSGTSTLGFCPDPVKTFNRGYTSYFLNGRDEKLAAPDSPKSIGESVGKVISINRGAFTLADNTPDLHPGDGICYINAENELEGTYVNAVDDRTIHADNIHGLIPGTEIFRNHDHKFIAQLNKSRPERKIQVHFSLERTPAGIRLIVEDEDQCRRNN